MRNRVSRTIVIDKKISLSPDAQKSIECITQQPLPYLLPQGMSRARDLLPFLPFGITTLWNYTKAGKFPKPVKISATVTAWRNAEVIAWLESHSITDDCLGG